MDGFDQDWSSWTAENKKEYSFLFEGDYTFQVKARNLYGTISNEGKYAFAILPPWFRSWWAYGLYGFFFIAGVVAVDRFQRKRLLKRQQDKLKAQQLELEKERSISDRLRKVDKLKDDFQ